MMIGTRMMVMIVQRKKPKNLKSLAVKKTIQEEAVIQFRSVYAHHSKQ